MTLTIQRMGAAPATAGAEEGLFARRGLCVALVAHLILIAFLAAARAPLLWLDHQVVRVLAWQVRFTRVEQLCYLMLQPGSAYLLREIGVVVATVLAMKRRWVRLAGWAVAMAGCLVLDYKLKALFHRPRPWVMGDWPGGSFPSGHVMGATVAYGMIAWLASGAVPRRYHARLLLGATGIVAMTTIGLLVPGYHYVTDVLGGYAIGVSWLVTCIGGIVVAERFLPSPRDTAAPAVLAGCGGEKL